MRLKLSINSIPGKTGGLKASLGYFDSSLSPGEAELIAELLWSFKKDDLHVLVAAYLFDGSRWEEARRLGWRPLLIKSFNRKGFFPRSVQYDWAVGSCPSAECLREVIHTGWNLSGNESLIMVLTQESDEVLARIGQTYEDDLEAVEQNELRWIDYCPLVSSRDHDGLTLRLYTAQAGEDQLRRHLERFFKSSAAHIEFSDEIL